MTKCKRWTLVVASVGMSFCEGHKAVWMFAIEKFNGVPKLVDGIGNPVAPSVFQFHEDDVG